MKYPDITIGRVEEVWDKLGGKEGVEKFLAGKLVLQEPVCKWRQEDGVIYFEVTSDGATGPQWIERLEQKGFRVSDNAKDLLRSPDFKPTSGVTTKIAVLPGMMFTDNERMTKKIREEAGRRKLVNLNTEVACLTREKFSDEDLEKMGFWWIVAFHDPIEDSRGGPSLLAVRRGGSGRWLGADYDYPVSRWNSGSGFAFALPQVSL